MPVNKRQSSYLHKQKEWKKLYESGMSYTKIGKLENVDYSTVQTVLKGIVKTRPKEQYAHKTEEWKIRYEVDEWSVNNIAKEANVDVATVSKYLKKAGVVLRNKVVKSSPFEECIPHWVQMYKDGNSLKDIADKYSTYPQTVHKHIKEKVEMREYTETSMVYELRFPDYLADINNHEKAYWLGVWYGTGFISKSINGYEATLTTTIKDVDTLRKFRDVILYEREVEVKNELVKLRIHNKVLYDSLLSHGLIRDKSRELTFPFHISPSFYCSFILGYYEGKGSCHNSTVTVKNKEYTQTSFRLYGTESMLQSLYEVIKTQVDVSLYFGTITDTLGSRGTLPCLRTNSFSVIEKLASWLYAHAETYAKHRDIRNYLKNR